MISCHLAEVAEAMKPNIDSTPSIKAVDTKRIHCVSPAQKESNETHTQMFLYLVLPIAAQQLPFSTNRLNPRTTERQTRVGVSHELIELFAPTTTPGGFVRHKARIGIDARSNFRSEGGSTHLSASRDTLFSKGHTKNFDLRTKPRPRPLFTSGK